MTSHVPNIPNIPVFTAFVTKGGSLKSRLCLLTAFHLSLTYEKRVLYIEADSANQTSSSNLRIMRETPPFVFIDSSTTSNHERIEKDGFYRYVLGKIDHYRNSHDMDPEVLIIDVGNSRNKYTSIGENSYTLIPSGPTTDDAREAVNTSGIARHINATSVVHALTLITRNTVNTAERADLCRSSFFPVMGTMMERRGKTFVNLGREYPSQEMMDWSQPMIDHYLITSGLGKTLNIPVEIPADTYRDYVMTPRGIVERTYNSDGTHDDELIEPIE